MLEKINAFLRKLSIPFNILNIIVGLLIGIAHVYLPFTSIFGLVLGIIMAISGSAAIGISYFFTTKATTPSPQPSPLKNEGEEVLDHPSPPKKRIAATAFLCFAIPMILLNSAASFFGMFTGILLLAAALAIPFAQPIVITIAIILGLILSIGTLINSWLQVNHIWESLKQPNIHQPTQQSNLDKKSQKFPVEAISSPSPIKKLGNRKTDEGPRLNHATLFSQDHMITEKKRSLSAPPSHRSRAETKLPTYRT